MSRILTPCNDSHNMGFQFGLEPQRVCHKRKYRWMFGFFPVVGSFVSVIPPLKGARPSLQFKVSEVEHIHETFYYPTKPEWKTIDLTFYDVRPGFSDPMNWILSIYDIRNGAFFPVINFPGTDPGNNTLPDDFKRRGILELYDGCGNVLESWTLDNCYPESIDFGDLDMESSDVVTVDVTLRYDRAYIT